MDHNNGGIGTFLKFIEIENTCDLRSLIMSID